MSSRRSMLFAIAALAPAALAPSPALAANTLSIALCNGQANAAVLRIPLHRSPLRAGDDPCCIKGCHAGCSRKRADREETPQV